MNDRPDRPEEPGTMPPPSRRSSLAGLAAEIKNLAATDPTQLAQRISALGIREQAELALRLPAAQRLAMLLHAPFPLRLVRALPCSEVYMTVREIGPADAIPLLALASAPQILHMIDLESWRKDRFDADRSGGWSALLLEAGDPTLRRFLRNADEEYLALLFSKWMRIEQIEYEDGADKHGHGQGDGGTEEGYLTPDGEHRFQPTIPEHAPAVRKLLQMLFTEDPERYQRILWSSRWELPSDLEEQALRWRLGRLEEHGFPDFDDALSVYAPPEVETPRPPSPDVGNPDTLPAARSPLRIPSARETLAPAIDLLDDAMREQTLSELISVANRLLVAEGADTGDPDAHQRALGKAVGFVEIGLKLGGAQDRATMAHRLVERPVLELFREGHAEAARLQEKARALLNRGWASRHDDALELLDSPIRERIDALLEPRPLYFEIEIDDGTGRGGQRDFRTLAELDESRVALEVAELFGRLVVEPLGLDVARILNDRDSDSGPGPKFSTFLLTAAAWVATRNEFLGDPLPVDVVADFLRNVASRRTASPDAPGRAFAALTDRLGQVVEISARETAVLAAFGRYCLEQLSEECGQLDPGLPPDPRSISCLLLEITTH